MKITSISQQQKNKERYNIFVAGKYLFSVDEVVLTKYQLFKDRELTDEELAEIQEEDAIRRGLNKAIQYLAHRVRSEKEIRTHLTKAEMEPDEISLVIKRLAEMKYINDLEFAHLYVRTQVNTTSKGPRQIERELVTKGITREYIEEALVDFKDDTQLENAVKLAAKIVNRSRKSAKRQLQQKLITELIQKGYTTDLAKEASAIALEDFSEEQEQDVLGEQLNKLLQRNRRLGPAKCRQKTITSLLQKGFSYDTIQDYMREHELDFEEEQD
ncbi:recombination regulator RecX [Listeria sp. FSL L7-1582]|uniref:Regulatory protein RecX n=1 Tax=Listeria rustica TaxID=2713503 RepID=A0A7W1T7Q2_9LIST|nr:MULTISPECIES: recombination regulator RecX [Listeria]MBA3926935.1 recombination regulator RecX [Listeria rustica]MBC6310954.1 recombination regulator RecX [Listeria portnoyi]